MNAAFNVSTSDYETLGIKIKHPNIKPFNIIAIYRPPSGKHKKFLDHLNLYLPDLISPRVENYILGDFNINYGSTELIKKYGFHKMESKLNITQYISEFTRISPNSKTIIDWIYSDSPYIRRTGVLDINLSDHLPIYLIRKKYRNKVEKHTITGRSYIRYDKAIFCNILSQKEWSVFDRSNDVNEMWQIFEKHISDSLNVMCPIKTVKVSDSKPVWLSNEIIQLMRRRDQAYIKAWRTGNSVDWRKATFLRNRVDTFIKLHKKEKITNNLEQHRNNPVKFWDEIKSVFPKEHSNMVNSLPTGINDQYYTGKNLCEHINTYFTQIGPNLANRILNSQQDRTRIISQLALNMNTDGITGTLFHADDLSKALRGINKNKTSALNNIRTSVIIDAFESNLNRALKMYNCSILNSTFPDAWKISIVVPLPKVTNPKQAADMRPISLIPLPGKILEHLISSRLKNYLETNNILTENQHGFRKNHSTISAICTLLHNVYTNFHMNKDTYLIYLDLKKAFDTVSHKILLNKLSRIGLDTTTISWFNSYLNNRKQYVKLNTDCSSLKNISYGVPQGSILGPTLFSLYINDLSDVLPKSSLLLYADDTVIHGTDPLCIQEMLNKVNKWCIDNLLTINCKKSQWMHTNIIEKNYNSVFLLGNIILEKVTEYKYLGLIIDSNLSFKTHRDMMVKRVNHKLSFFRRIRQYINDDTAQIIYKTMILPIIEYADFAYDNNIKYINQKLQTLQNQGLYIVFDQHTLPYDIKESTESLHRRAKLFRLIHRRRLHLLSYAFRLSNVAEYLDLRDIHTRQHEAKMFMLQKFDHYKCTQDPYYRAMSEWNNLNVEARNSLTKQQFLNIVKTQIVNPYKKTL